MADREIAGLALGADRPQDLDAQLLASTGCDAAEVARMLAGRPGPDLVARAIAPFAATLPRVTIATIAAGVVVADLPTVIAELRALYAAPARRETRDGE